MVKPESPSLEGEETSVPDGAERRKHVRVQVPLKARFLKESGEEARCIVIDISAGGALLRAKHPPAFGQTVIIYIDQLGRFEGKVIRSGPDSFAVTYESTRIKTARTADTLTQIVNHGRRAADRRNNPRLAQDAPAVVYFEDGRSEKCAILDISLTGASIEINPRPPLGAHLILGRMTAKVVRRHDKGVGVVFTGSAKRMEDIIQTASDTGTPPEFGAAVAPSFGKKGDSA